MLKADAVKSHPSQWPDGGSDTIFVRLDAEGAVRWTRNYGGGVYWSQPEFPLWGMAVPGTAAPWDCAMGGSTVPPNLLFFDGVCD